eukprot:3033071-Rhodomonas_salina.1
MISLQFVPGVAGEDRAGGWDRELDHGRRECDPRDSGSRTSCGLHVPRHRRSTAFTRGYQGSAEPVFQNLISTSPSTLDLNSTSQTETHTSRTIIAEDVCVADLASSANPTW